MLETRHERPWPLTLTPPPDSLIENGEVGMRWLKNWRKKRQEESGNAADFLALSRTVGPMIERASQEVFREHRDALLSEPITYIVPAVWGARKEGPLTETQTAIHQDVLPLIQTVVHLVSGEGATPAQEHALSYLVRGLLVSKITYLIVSYQNQMLSRQCRAVSELAAIEPVGRA